MVWHIPVWHWLVHTALGGSVALVVGWLALKIVKQPVVRLRVMELTLLGCLLVSFAGCVPGLPRLSMPLLGGGIGEEPAAVAVDDRDDAERSPAASGFRPLEQPGQGDAWKGSAEVVGASKQPASAVTATQREHTLEGWPLPPPPPLPPLSLLVVCLYFGGAMLVGGRWVLALVLLGRLRRSAFAAGEKVAKVFAEVTAGSGEKVRLLASRHVALPMTFYWWRPVILLPAKDGGEVDEAGLRFGLAHEWSHVERGDIGRWHLATLVEVLFFWQPLFWGMRRQLRLDQDFLADGLAAMQAEEVEDYAAYLVMVAKRALGRPLAGTLAIADQRSNLSRRVLMLLNNEKPLQRRCGGLWNLALVGAALALAVLVSAVRLDAGDSAKKTDKTAQAAKSDKDATTKVAEEVKGETLHYSGTVTNKDTGKPIEGAIVTVRRSLYGDPEVKASEQVIEETKHKTDGKGKYTFSIPPAQVAKRYLYIELDVEGPGYAPQRGFGYSFEMIRKNEKLGGKPFFESVTLRPGKEISGVLETPDGKPAVGVKVMSYSVTTKKAEGTFEYGSFAETKTDAKGRYTLTLVTPGLAAYWVLPKEYAPATFGLKKDKRGDMGKIVLQKGVVLKGKVVDAKGKLMPRVFVEATKTERDEALDQLMVADHIRRTVETNDKGEFSFGPLPAGKFAVKPVKSGYDPSSEKNRREERDLSAVFLPQQIQLKDGEKPEELTVQAVPHVIVEGQYYDSKGTKIRGHSTFLAGQNDGMFWHTEMKVDAGGKVRALVPHGLAEVRVQMMTNEHGALRHRKDKSMPLSRGRELNLGTVEADVTGFEIVRYKAPILLIKVTTKGKATAKGLAVTATYPPQKGLQEGRFIVAGGRNSDVTFEMQEDGRFRSSQLLPDEETTITAYAEGYAEKSVKVKAAEGTTKEVEIVLEAN